MNLPPQSFTVSYDGRARVLMTPVRVTQAFDRTKMLAPPTDLHEFNAIWDTGATSTVITQTVAKRCGLTAMGMTDVETAAGTRRAPLYLISLQLPNAVGISQLTVTEGILTGNVNVLIGMDVISAGDFAVTCYKGQTIFSFRYPSLEQIDFVTQHPHRLNKVVGRNAPCPCGSGKKYKQCHGRHPDIPI